MVGVSDFEYFLCLPQHKKECLHWLNGGEVEFEDDDGEWVSCSDWSKKWRQSTCGFMQDDNVIRIKPKKVKRWIGVHAKSGLVTQGYCDTEREIEEHILRGACSPKAKFCDWQFIEIELEE